MTNACRLLNIEPADGSRRGLGLKAGWGIGTLIAILFSVVVYLLNIVDLRGLASLILLLCGLWTLLSAFVIVERKDRSYYSGWGIVLASLSLFDFIPFNYTIALVILAIIALIIINVYIGKTPKLFTAATSSPAPVGGTPAAWPTWLVRSRPTLARLSLWSTSLFQGIPSLRRGTTRICSGRPLAPPSRGNSNPGW